MNLFLRRAVGAAFLVSLFAVAQLRAAEPAAPPSTSATPATPATPDKPAASGVPVLPGSDVPIEKLVAEPVTIVAQATLEYAGALNPPRFAEDSYDNVKFKITKFFKGKFQKTVFVSLWVSPSEGQVMPVKGKEYVIFFYQPQPVSRYLSHVPGEKPQMRPIIPCLKVLPADAATVAKVKSVIASTPLRKPEPTPKPEPVPAVDAIK